MQADEFEKKIQNKMEGFGLVPDGEVWKQVAGRIEKDKKKRRVLFYWLFTGFALLAGTSALWFMHTENNRKLLINEVNNNVLKRENYKRKQDANNSENLSKVKKLQPPKSIRYLNKYNLKSRPATETKINPRSKIIYTKLINRKRILSEQKEYNKLYKEKILAQKPLPSHRFYNPGLTKIKVDSLLESTSATEKTIFKKDTSTNTLAKQTIRKTSKKWNAGFTVYSGISDNLSGLLLLEKSYAESLRFSPGSTLDGNYNSVGNSNYYINTLNNYKSAFSFGLGVFIKKVVYKKINLSAGVDYHFYQAKSTVGSKVNQERSFYDSLSQNSISVNSFYSIGNSVTYSNKYHLLELPVNMVIQLNKNQKRPFSISAGISPGYLLGSNALHVNTSSNVYYVDKEKLHRFQLSAQAGLLFPISGSNKYLLNAGPAVQYGFTNAAKTVTGGSQHLFFTGLKANIILK